MLDILRGIDPAKPVTIFLKATKSKEFRYEMVDWSVVKDKKRAPIRYSAKEISIFIDEQSENVPKEFITFRNGKVTYIPQDNMSIHEFFMTSMQYNPKTPFERLDLDARIKELNEANDVEDKAYEQFILLKQDPERLLELIRYYDIKGESIAEKEIVLRNICKSRPADFLKHLSDPNLSYRAIASEAIASGLALYQPATKALSWTAKAPAILGGSTFMVVSGSKPLEAFTEYLAKPENLNVFEELYASLNTKKTTTKKK